VDFVAIDVETANPNMASICQIGIAGYLGGQLVLQWKSFVDPTDWFSPVNVGIHGITTEMVAGAPAFQELAPVLRKYLEGNVVVCHTPFDRVSIHRAFDAHGLVAPTSRWLDSARVARRTWKEVSRRGYGLANVCRLINHEFAHHDALEDAKAAGQVLLAAMESTGLSVEDWLRRVERPIDLPSAEAGRSVALEANPEGPLFGEVMVFTGALQIPRQKAADMAAQIGCHVGVSVTRQTTMLVVGDQDLDRLSGHVKSIKHRKAEQLIAKGQAIRILAESDFMRLVDLETSQAGA
jgi:DNA polymerase-3 subunit epsilon